VRNIVILLLLSNVAYFFWSQFKSKPEDFTTVQSPTSPGENTLVLLSELNSAPLAAETNNVESDPRPSTVCFSIGDFLDVSDANQFRDFVGAEGFESTLNLTQYLERSSYRVYLPSFSSLGIAAISLEAIKDALVAAGLTLESSLITEGSLENGIAFGLFNTQDEAVNIQVQLAGLGYVADIDQVFQADSIFRVLVRASNSSPFELQIWPKIQIERPYLNSTENLCETIAQGAQFP